MQELSPQQEKQLVVRREARNRLIAFACAVDAKYDPQWFHEIIAAKLEEIVRRLEAGESPRLMIHMPPRHGKSDLSTQKFPAWVFGSHPEWPMIISSYAQDLATKFGSGTRDIMNTQNYRAIFSTRLRADTQAKSSWATTRPGKKGEPVPAGGGYEAAGIGGPITGKGFKIGIIDDPFKNFEEADSPVVRENVHNWYKSTFYTRQEGAAAIIIIDTRWHEDDLDGRLLKEQEEAEEELLEAIEDGAGEEVSIDRWEVLDLAALAPGDEPPHRAAGEPLWPAKFNTAKLNRIKKALGPYLFSAMYQQNPYSVDTQEFREDWKKYRLSSEVDALQTRKFATIDTALGKKRAVKLRTEDAGGDPDYTGVARNYVDLGNNWNLKVRRYEINSAGLVELIFTLHAEGFEAIGIEEGAYEAAVRPFIEEEMRNRGKYPNIVGLKHHQTMKETRIRGLIPRYAAGQVYHIVGECDDLEAEQRRFPRSKHDDCMDAAAYQLQIAEAPTQEGEEDLRMY